MMDRKWESTTASRLATLVGTGGMAAMLAFAPVAFATEPSAGTQTGTGVTDVNVQLADVAEHSGTHDSGNQDADGDNLGDNIAFTVPSEINFVADSQGNLTGPSAAEAYLENESVFPIHASSLDVDPQGGWTVIDDGSNATGSNAIDFQIGPAADKLDAYDYLQKASVHTPSAWNMTAKTDDGISDRVPMASSGNIFNVDKDISSKTKVATMTWYVTPGRAS